MMQRRRIPYPVLLRYFYLAAFIASISLFLISCGDRSDEPVSLSSSQARPSADWVRDAVIYEVYLRSFSPEGTFEGLRRRLPELRDLGATVLWLMPIHPIGYERRKGTLGSPFAVRDYMEVNPEFGTLDDLRSLVDDVHRLDMKIVIDLVANHTSWDNVLIDRHPEWYVRNESGEIISPNEDWWDVADLDFSNRELQEYMLGVMRYWVEEIGIDGFRCDVSELVPTDFWEDGRTMLDGIKPVLMLSEGSLPEHHLQAFDITYGWNIYHALPAIMHGDEPAAALDEVIAGERNIFPRGSLRLRFSSNHDENAWDAPAVEKWGSEGARAAAMLVTTMEGIPLLYNGDEVGNMQRLDLFEKVDIDWSAGSGYREFYKELLNIYHSSPALRRGSTLRLPSSDDAALYAFVRHKETDHKLVVLNLKPYVVRGTLETTGLLHSIGRRTGDLVRLTGNGEPSMQVSHTMPLSVDLPGFGYVIYDVR